MTTTFAIPFHVEGKTNFVVKINGVPQNYPSYSYNKIDNTIEIPKATTYCRKNPCFTITCLEDSKPLMIPEIPLAIKKIDNTNPEDNKPE